MLFCCVVFARCLSHPVRFGFSLHNTPIEPTNAQSHIELDPSARRLAINIEYDEKAGSAPAASAGAAKGVLLFA